MIGFFNTGSSCLCFAALPLLPQALAVLLVASAKSNGRLKSKREIPGKAFALSFPALAGGPE